MKNSEAIKIIEDVANDNEWEVRDDYSGRGMFGAECYGVVCSDSDRCIEEMAERGIKRARVDSMGLDSIVYWERIRKSNSPDKEV